MQTHARVMFFFSTLLWLFICPYIDRVCDTWANEIKRNCALLKMNAKVHYVVFTPWGGNKRRTKDSKGGSNISAMPLNSPMMHHVWEQTVKISTYMWPPNERITVEVILKYLYNFRSVLWRCPWCWKFEQQFTLRCLVVFLTLTPTHSHSSSHAQ